jgi:hypothetical protein
VWMRAPWVKKRNTRKEQMFTSSGHSSRCLEGVPLQFQRAKPKRRVLTMPACIRVSATGCVDPGVNGSSPSARRGRLSHVEPELVDGRDAAVPPDLGNRLGRALGKRLQRAGRISRRSRSEGFSARCRRSRPCIRGRETDPAIASRASIGNRQTYRQEWTLSNRHASAPRASPTISGVPNESLGYACRSGC